MRRIRLRPLFPAIVLVASLLPGVAPLVVASTGSGTAGQEEPCTWGGAQALVEALPVAAALQRRGQDHPGLLEAYVECQYRVFLDGMTFTFCEDDFIVGGIALFYDYKAAGLPRAQAIAELDLETDRVWIDGVEQVLQESAYKDADIPSLGIIVYQHHAFITKLQAGDHVSVWVGSYPGFPDETATVSLHILPRERCA